MKNIEDSDCLKKVKKIIVKEINYDNGGDNTREIMDEFKLKLKREHEKGQRLRRKMISAGMIFLFFCLTVFLAYLGTLSVLRFRSEEKISSVKKDEVFYVISVKGDVLHARSGNIFTKLNPGDAVSPGETVKTGVNSYCGFQLYGTGNYELGGPSEITINKILNKSRVLNAEISLASGSLFLRSRKLHHNESFTVLAGSVKATAAGTIFGVSKAQDGIEEIGVLEGNVGIENTSSNKFLNIIKSGEAFEISIPAGIIKMVKKNLSGNLITNLSRLAFSAGYIDPSHAVQLSLRSERSGVLVYINNKYRGSTPCRILVNSDDCRKAVVLFKMDGCKNGEYILNIGPGERNGYKNPDSRTIVMPGQ